DRFATVAGVGIALPPPIVQTEVWDEYFAFQYAGPRRALARRIFENAGVRPRRAAVSPLLEDVSDWSTERRMRRYQLEAMPPGKEGAERAPPAGGLKGGGGG